LSDPVSPLFGLIRQAAPVDYNRTAVLKTEDPASQKQAREARLKKATQDFESLFLHNLLKKMRATVPKTEKSQFGMETMRDITDEQLAIHLARQGGVGLGEMLFKSLQEREGHTTAPGTALRGPDKQPEGLPIHRGEHPRPIMQPARKPHDALALPDTGELKTN
jgi:flagellar protein FlgJ